MERRLGKRLSANDLKILLTLYDHLALPGEVILMLVTWCIEETERKYGRGGAPSSPRCARRALPGPGRGIDTVGGGGGPPEKAGSAAHQGTEVLRLLDIPGPPPGGAGEDLYRRLAGYGL